MQSFKNKMKTRPIKYLYNFYTKDDGEGSPIVIEIDGYKVQIGINVVILPGFHIKPCKGRAGQLTIVGSNCFLGKGESLEEGSVLPEGTILQGEPLLKEDYGIKVLLAADDLGRKNETNVAIFNCFREGLIHHASIMVNCPFYEEAVTLTKDFDLEEAIGLHFDVLEGEALSKLENRGRYNMNWANTFGYVMNGRRSAFFLFPREKKQLKDELQKQIDAYLSSGLKTLYFDSHGNIHFKYPIAKIVAKEIKGVGFTYVRIPRDESSRHRIYNLLFKRRVINLYRKSFKTSDAFLNAADLLDSSILDRRGQTMEVMVHPFLRNDKVINRRDVSFPVLFAFCKACNIEIIEKGAPVCSEKSRMPKQN